MRFTEEDKEMVARLIRGFEHDLEELRHDQYGHSEIVSDLKESCREKIGWLETFQKRMEQEQAAMNRIRQLFDEFISVVDKTTDQNAYAQVLKVFSIGYQLGWNDQHNIAKMERTININGN